MTIGNSVKSIGDYAFDGCPNLASLNIPKSVTAIGGAAFFNAPYHYVRIPGSVTSIGEKAFAGCWFRSVVCFAATPPVADAYLFLNGSTEGFALLCVPVASIEAYKMPSVGTFFAMSMVWVT